jgi:rhamnosyltransferase
MKPTEHPQTVCPTTSVSHRFLVLLAAYNGANWIRAQIESILGQVGVNVRLVVRDDRSQDSTIAIVREIAATDTRVELLHSDAASGSASQNFFSLIRSCDATGFDFIALSDQDDIWDPDKLYQAAALLTNSQSCAYSSAVTAIWPTGRPRLLQQNCPVTESDYLLEGAGQGCTFVLSVLLYARLRSFLTAHESLTRDIYFHDWAIYALTRTWGLKWTFNPRSTMTYRQHSSNDTGARSSLGGIAMRLRRIRQGWYIQQLLRISELCRAASENDPTITCWYTILRAPKGWRRRITLVQFLLRGGRRRASDNVILTLAALAGWI